MRRMARLRWLGALVLVGCASTVSVVQQRASSDLHCPRERIGVTEIGGHGYRAVGCGRARSYTCARSGSVTCTGDTDVETVPEAPAGRGAVAGEDAASALSRTTHAAVRGCIEDPGLTLALLVEIGPEGTVRPLEIQQRVSAREAGCISAVARGADGTPWPGSGQHLLTYAPGAPAPAPVTSAPEVVAEPSAPPGEPPTLRARVDAHRAAVLACVPGAAVALALEWAADGTIVAHLRDRPGSVEEGCVRAVLATERLDPPPGSAGSLLHVVEAPGG